MNEKPSIAEIILGVLVIGLFAMLTQIIIKEIVEKVG